MGLTWALPGEWNGDGWRHGAACRHGDPGLFFPVGATGKAVDHAEAAKAVCRRCPVSAACLEFALVSNQESGVWGGTTEEERRMVRRARREHVARTASGPAALTASAQQAVELAPDDGVALTR